MVQVCGCRTERGEDREAHSAACARRTCVSLGLEAWLYCHRLRNVMCRRTMQYLVQHRV